MEKSAEADAAQALAFGSFVNSGPMRVRSKPKITLAPHLTSCSTTGHKMAMTPRLHTISAAAVELSRDRRTIAAALARVAPDGRVGRHPGWRLVTILNALGGWRSAQGQVRADILRTADDIERVADDLETSFARLAAEHDMSRRRELAGSIGPKVGKLIRSLDESVVQLPVEEQPFARAGIDRICKDAIEKLCRLCNWRVAPMANFGRQSPAMPPDVHRPKFASAERTTD